MGSDDLFKKRREARIQRKHEYKSPKANSDLSIQSSINPVFSRHIAY